MKLLKTENPINGIWYFTSAPKAGVWLDTTASNIYTSMKNGKKVKGENKTLVDASTDFVANELLSFLKDGDFDKLMRNVNGFKPE